MMELVIKKCVFNQKKIQNALDFCVTCVLMGENGADFHYMSKMAQIHSM